MNKGVLIGLVFLSIFIASFSWFVYDGFSSEITGRQVFLDDGFERSASSFRPSDSSDISFSPDNNCIINSISLSHEVARIEDFVSIYVDGTGCKNDEFEINVFEKDQFFSDYVTVLSGTFLNDRASVDWAISEDYTYLFDEIFEGEQIEIYFEISFKETKLFSGLLYIPDGGSSDILLQPNPINYVERGCTTVWYIDEDCDGYGVGKQSGGQYGRVAVDIYGNLPDADDLNPLVNTPQSVVQQFGDPATNINNLRNFLVSRGYNTPRNIYFVSLGGNDNTGQANNINLPFRSFGAVRSRLGSNDFVLYRGGYYADPQGVLRIGSGSVVPRGTLNNPIVIMSYPGENVVFDSYASIGYTAGVENMVIDGFVATCETGGCSSNGIGEQGVNIIGSADNLTLRNLEVLRHRWGIWGGTPKDGVVIERSVVHDNSNEHGIYIPNSDEDPMTNFVIKDNLVYRNRRTGIQFNGKMDGFIVEGNIVHSNALNGLTLTNGVQYSTFRNNLIFNNNKQGVVIFSYCDSAYFTCSSLYSGGCMVGLVPECPTGTTSCNRALYPQCYGDGADYRQSNDYNQFINNLIWVGRDYNGVCENDWYSPTCIHSNPFDFPAIELADNTPRDVYTFTGNIFRNNIFNTNAAPVFKMDRLNHLLSPGTLIENNLFLRNNGEPAGLGSATTDGSHTSTFQIVNTVYYAWDFYTFQDRWSSFIRNNIQGNPQFTDVSLSYALLPWAFNFDPTPNSLSIDGGIFLNAPLTDLKGSARSGNVDLGTYEFSSSTSGPPNIITISPNPIYNSQPNLVYFIGTNFNVGSVLETCVNNVCNQVSESFAVVNSQQIELSLPQGYPAGTYEFRVRNPNNDVSNRLNLVVEQISLPNAPSNLVATVVSSTRIDLNWNDMSSNEDRFIIEYKLSSSPTWLTVPGASNLPANTVSYSVTGLAPSNSYNFRAFSENSVGRSISSGVITAITFVCDNGQVMACPNQAGACAGAQQTCTNGNWPGCDSATYELNNAAYNINEIGLCSDSINNDCDLNGEFDYAGSGTTRGDNDCPIEITGINAPSSAGVSSPFTLTCTSSVANVRSVQGSIGSNLCSFVNWQGSNALFTCLSSIEGNHQLNCNVNTAYSYQTGSNLNRLINIGGSCSGYSTSNSCEGDSSCDWCIGCSGTLSSGAGNRCVSAGSCGVGAYQCIINQCGAVCDGTVNGCSSSQRCNLATCGCIEESPVISSVLPISSIWGSANILTISGQFFASNAEVIVNGNIINSGRITRSSNTLIFNRLAEEFNVGNNQIVVRNPGADLSSNSFNFVLTSNPVINSLVPDNMMNNVLTVLNIFGSSFDPLSRVMIFGTVQVPSSYVTYVNSGLIQINVVPGLEGGDYSLSIRNGDGTANSNSRVLRINYPFNYLLTLSNSGVSLNAGETFNGAIKIESLIYMIQENVNLSVLQDSGVSVSFIGESNCSVNVLATPYPNCEIGFGISTAGLSPGTYNVKFGSNSSATSIEHEVDFIVTINTPGGSGGSGGSGGGSSGGGGGSGGGSRPRVSYQCDDNIDNDNDGNIDYPEDLGCSSENDNSEVNPIDLVESNYSFVDDGPQNLDEVEKEIEVRLVFWIVITIIVIGIVIVVASILNSIRKKNLFLKLVQS